MSHPEPDDSAKIVDEERYTDKKLKDRILDARERVADREDTIFVEARMSTAATESELTQLWLTSVRQYLKTIEPLLRSEEIEDAHHYYRELPIYQTTIYPPDGETAVRKGNTHTTTEIQWSVFYQDNVNTFQIMRDHDLIGPGFEPPEPEPYTVTGLKDVIEKATKATEWYVELNPNEFGPRLNIAHPTTQTHLPRDRLEFAVRKADEFLHNAGIGLQIDAASSEASFNAEDILEDAGF